MYRNLGNGDSQVGTNLDGVGVGADPLMDAQLVARSGSFGPATQNFLASLYQEYAARVYRFFCSKRLSREDAEDLVVDVLTRAARAAVIRTAQTRTGPLFLIAKGVFVDACRRAACRPQISYADSAAALLAERCDAQLGPEETALEQDWRATLLEAVDRVVGGRDAEIIRLRLTAELDCAEIAQQLGMAHGAVRTRFSRACRRLSADQEVRRLFHAIP